MNPELLKLIAQTVFTVAGLFIEVTRKKDAYTVGGKQGVVFSSEEEAAKLGIPLKAVVDPKLVEGYVIELDLEGIIINERREWMLPDGEYTFTCGLGEVETLSCGAVHIHHGNAQFNSRKACINLNKEIKERQAQGETLAYGMLPSGKKDFALGNKEMLNILFPSGYTTGNTAVEARDNYRGKYESNR